MARAAESPSPEGGAPGDSTPGFRVRGNTEVRVITKWDIFYYVYGLLHHPDYRDRYADNLKKELPRIPFVPSSPPDASGGDLEGGGFWAFSEAGKQLADLHLHYEEAPRYKLDWEVTGDAIDYRVEKMRQGKKYPPSIPPSHGGKSSKSPSLETGEGDLGDEVRPSYKIFDTLKYNDTLTLSGIPAEAFAYRLGNKSALEWVIDQYRIKTDKRSGITHDPNGYSEDDQYIVKLIEQSSMSAWRR